MTKPTLIDLRPTGCERRPMVLSALEDLPASRTEESTFEPSGRHDLAPALFEPLLLGGFDVAKVSLVAFEPGPCIPRHISALDLCLVVIQGTGVLTAGARRHRVGPGSVASIPGGWYRGLDADTRLVVVHVAAPPDPIHSPGDVGG